MLSPVICFALASLWRYAPAALLVCGGSLGVPRICYVRMAFAHYLEIAGGGVANAPDHCTYLIFTTLFQDDTMQTFLPTPWIAVPGVDGAFVIMVHLRHVVTRGRLKIFSTIA